jgi:cytochrome c553
MDFTNHPLNNYRQSIIDGREINKVNPSIIDNYTTKLRTRFRDHTIGERFVAKLVQTLSESDIEDLADYVQRTATIHQGKAFVKLASKVMNHKTVA